MTRLEELSARFPVGARSQLNRSELRELCCLLFERHQCSIPTVEYVKRKLTSATIDLAEAMERLEKQNET